MAMVGGSVTVNADGTYTGTGLALALFTARLALFPADEIDPTTPKYSMSLATWQAAVVQRLNGVAALANADGPAIVTYLTNHADVTATATVGTSGAFNGIQRTGSSFVANADLAAPTSPKAIPVAGGPTSGAGGLS